MADASERFCRRCFLYESGETDVLEDIRKRIERLPVDQRADRAVYRSRLEVCGGCDHLVGGTCMKCGCYPEFRAAFRKNRCPAGKWNAD